MEAVFVIGENIMDLDRIIEQALDCKIVSENTVRFLCEKMKEVLIEESNVLQLQSPITVVGDVHGYVLSGSYCFV